MCLFYAGFEGDNYSYFPGPQCGPSGTSRLGVVPVEHHIPCEVLLTVLLNDASSEVPWVGGVKCYGDRERSVLDF